MTGFTGYFEGFDAQRQARRRGPWVMTMDWKDLLFAHWPVEPRELARLLPDGLEPDCREGRAWVGIVPFHMGRNRLRWLPPLPGTGRFAELNLRTYVRPTDGRGQGGVYFITLDATAPLAIAIARLWYGLPYTHAAIDYRRNGEAYQFASVRKKNGARFVAEHQPTGDTFEAEPGSLEHWLVERYRLYCARNGHLLVGEIAHEPWRLRRAEAIIESQTLDSAVGLRLNGPPVSVLFAKHIRTRFWWPRRVRRVAVERETPRQTPTTGQARGADIDQSYATV